MHTTQPERGTLFSVSLVIVIAFLLIALKLTIQYVDVFYRFFADYTKFPVVELLIDFLFVWLMLLLFLLFRRWRRVENVKADLDAVLSSISPDALLVVGRDRTIRMCNDSVERIFGQRPEDVINQTTDLLYYDRRSNTERPQEIFEVLARKGFHYGLAKGKRKDGSTVPLEIISGELVGRSGAVLLVRDITERLVLEEQRRRLEERALQAQKLESLGILAGGVAHDFNNLLMIIQGHAELITMRSPSEDFVREGLTEVMKASNRARELCRHLLSFAGRAPREVRLVNLSEVAKDAVGMLSVRIPPGVRVVLDMPAQLPTILADESQVHQVVMNLITNACDAIGAEGEIRVSTGDCLCDAEFLMDVAGPATPQPGPYVRLAVADNGSGMDEATRKRLCEPFFTTKSSGNGMGMAAVLGIVRSHHGLLKVTSQPGVGTTVAVLFPKIDGAPVAD